MTKKWTLGRVIKIILIALPLAALATCYVRCTIADMRFEAVLQEARECFPEIREELEQCVYAILPALRANDMYASVGEDSLYIELLTFEEIEKWRVKYGDETADALTRLLEWGMRPSSLKHVTEGSIKLHLIESNNLSYHMWYEFAMDGRVIATENGSGLEVLGDDWYLFYYYKS